MEAVAIRDNVPGNEKNFISLMGLEAVSKELVEALAKASHTIKLGKPEVRDEAGEILSGGGNIEWCGRIRAGIDGQRSLSRTIQR